MCRTKRTVSALVRIVRSILNGFRDFKGPKVLNVFKVVRVFRDISSAREGGALGRRIKAK